MTRAEWAFGVTVGLLTPPLLALGIAVVGARRWRKRVHWAVGLEV